MEERVTGCLHYLFVSLFRSLSLRSSSLTHCASCAPSMLSLSLSALAFCVAHLCLALHSEPRMCLQFAIDLLFFLLFPLFLSSLLFSSLLFSSLLSFLFSYLSPSISVRLFISSCFHCYPLCSLPALLSGSLRSTLSLYSSHCRPLVVRSSAWMQ